MGKCEHGDEWDPHQASAESESQRIATPTTGSHEGKESDVIVDNGVGSACGLEAAYRQQMVKE